MKYALEEFRVGRWDRLSGPPFDEWVEADKFINKLHEFYPLRQYRIVELAEKTPSAGAPNERP